MAAYDDAIARGKARHGDKWSDAELLPAFRRWYGTGERVKVRYTYRDGSTEDTTGTIGMTTGWRPAFLLIRTSRSIGSSYVIGQNDKVVAVKRGSKYVSLEG